MRAVASPAWARTERCIKRCVLSFDSPSSATGVYVNAETLYGYGRRYVALDNARTGCETYVCVRTTRTPKKRANGEGGAANETPTTLGFGVDGGFASEEDNYDVHTTYSLVFASDFDDVSRVLPIEGWRNRCERRARKSRKARLSDTEETKSWQEMREVSKYALELAQENNGKKIPSDPSAWRCEETGESGNLWVNLSDVTRQRRRHFDGSGGNGSALRHYEAMKAQGKHYPLVVKLGTITASGADVYSYAPDEGDMVEDPYLAEHLRHWVSTCSPWKRRRRAWLNYR